MQSLFSLRDGALVGLIHILQLLRMTECVEGDHPLDLARAVHLQHVEPEHLVLRCMQQELPCTRASFGCVGQTDEHLYGRGV